MMDSKIEDKKNLERVAIVSVGYNRLRSQKRLLESLLKADYTGYGNVPLVISIDASGDEELYSFAKGFDWPYGDKYVFIKEKRMGLKDHIFWCGDLTDSFKGIILLEDDLVVAEDFYHYACEAIFAYETENKVASISLYNPEMNGFCWLPFYKLRNNEDVYAFQAVFSWGECWTRRMWADFKKWRDTHEIQWEKVDMPEQISTWTKAWSKFYHAYMVENDLYSIVPYTSLTTNFSDAGEHGGDNNTIVQVNLQYGKKEYRMGAFDGLVKYDSYANNIALCEALRLKREEVCLDFYGNRSNRFNRRYILSIRALPYKVKKQYGLYMRPHELNVLCDVPGNDIFLYDTSVGASKPKGVKFGKTLLYHLHGYSYRLLPKACWAQFKVLVNKVWHKYV